MQKVGEEPRVAASGGQFRTLVSLTQKHGRRGRKLYIDTPEVEKGKTTAKGRCDKRRGGTDVQRKGCLHPT